jgi:predicted dithiol-disulfide oxidoreductase (DUF899 family)
MTTPRIVTPQQWQEEWQRLLVKEKEMTRAHDALAAQRRRMPWVSVDRRYTFEGPDGTMSLLDLFDGRRQVIVYRAFFDPGVHGQPDGTAGVERGRACVGCSMFADDVVNLAHLNARDVTLVFASRAPQPDIPRLKEQMAWKMPWYTITDSFDADFGVDQWAGNNAFIRDGDRVFRTYFVNAHGGEALCNTWGSGHDRARAPRELGGFSRRATRRGRRMSGGGGTTNTTTPQQHRPTGGRRSSTPHRGRFARRVPGRRKSAAEDEKLICEPFCQVGR